MNYKTLLTISLTFICASYTGNRILDPLHRKKYSEALEALKVETSAVQDACKMRNGTPSHRLTMITILHEYIDEAREVVTDHGRHDLAYKFALLQWDLLAEMPLSYWGNYSSSAILHERALRIEEDRFYKRGYESDIPGEKRCRARDALLLAAARNSLTHAPKFSLEMPQMYVSDKEHQEWIDMNLATIQSLIRAGMMNPPRADSKDPARAEKSIRTHYQAMRRELLPRIRMVPVEAAEEFIEIIFAVDLVQLAQRYGLSDNKRAQEIIAEAKDVVLHAQHPKLADQIRKATEFINRVNKEIAERNI